MSLVGLPPSTSSQPGDSRQPAYLPPQGPAPAPGRLATVEWNGREWVLTNATARAPGLVLPSTAAPFLTPSARAGGGYAGAGAGVMPDSNFSFFNSLSVWRKPAIEPQHPASAAIIARMYELAGTKPANLVLGAAELAGEHDFGHPIYYARPDDSLVTLEPTEGGLNLSGLQIRVPSAAKPAKGSDKHMVVVQPNGLVYSFWKASAPAGGKLAFAIGGVNIIGGSGLDLPIGATAANFSGAAGIIRAAELMADNIPHALSMTVGHCTNQLGFGFGVEKAATNSAYVYPATHGGSGENDPNLPPLGAKIRLKMSEAEIAALACKWYEKTILRALATYGGYIGDTSGGTFGFMVESGEAYKSFGLTDPLKLWGEAEGLAAGEGEFAGSRILKITNAMSEAEWKSRLEVLTPPSH